MLLTFYIYTGRMGKKNFPPYLDSEATDTVFVFRRQSDAIINDFIPCRDSKGAHHKTSKKEVLPHG